MPQKKKQPNPKNKKWTKTTEDFVKEWPDVLEGLSFKSFPIRFISYVNIHLKNGTTMKLDVQKELKQKSQKFIADWIKKYINTNYKAIQHFDLKFDVTKLKAEMNAKTDKILNKTFKKI